MKPMDLQQCAELLTEVWEEERKQMEGIVVCVHPTEEEQIRRMLDEAGYEPVRVLGNQHIEPGNCYMMREPDFTTFPAVVRRNEHRKPLWRRIADSLA